MVNVQKLNTTEVNVSWFLPRGNKKPKIFILSLYDNDKLKLEFLMNGEQRQMNVELPDPGKQYTARVEACYVGGSGSRIFY